MGTGKHKHEDESRPEHVKLNHEPSKKRLITGLQQSAMKETEKPKQKPQNKHESCSQNATMDKESKNDPPLKSNNNQPKKRKKKNSNRKTKDDSIYQTKEPKEVGKY